VKRVYLVLPLILILCFLVGCRDKKAMGELEKFQAQAAVEERNKEIVRRTHDEVWSGKNMDAVEDLYDAEYVAHWANGPDTHGLDELRTVIQEAHSIFPDMTEQIEQMVAEGDLVVSRFSSGGTFTGEIMGISPDNQQVTREEIAIHRIVDGKIVEQWTAADSLGLMLQLGMELRPREGGK